jgi:hypothetical protein
VRFPSKPIEQLEQLRQLGFREALSCVFHTDANPLCRIDAALDCHRSRGSVVFDRVGQQIDHYLFDSPAIGKHESAALQARKLDGNGKRFCQWLDHRLTFEHDLGQRHGLQSHRQLARFDLGEVENFTDQFREIPAAFLYLRNAALLRVA